MFANIFNDPVNPLHPSNAPDPTYVTLDGISNEPVNLLQLVNAPSPIYVTHNGSFN